MTAPQPDRARLIRAVRGPLAPISHQDLSRRVRAGDLERVRRGVARPAPVPLKLVDRAERYPELRRRYLDQILAVAETRKGQVVFTGLAALAIWDLPVIDGWPGVVELLEPPSSARRSKNGVIVHRSAFDAADVVPWGDHYVTTAARTLADLARTPAFTASVIALDHALSRRATAGQRLTKDAVREVLERSNSARGAARAEAVLEFADGRSGSAGESLSRVGIFQLGFEMPDLQVRHRHPSGYYEVDFKWPRSPTRPPSIGEFDGMMKYLNDDVRGELEPAEIVFAEKVREDFLRDEGNGFTRWGWREARAPRRLLRPKLERLGIRVVRRPLI
ncbi:hypothetical protein ACFOYW_01705 [Gryllotalpicola reticulitermitis]|uniref:Transcriptional regulator, AbiEi antitoxin, Type IV TA system n=1 Tax=Gryllotalpicola reticulitermitis TaxID=1184153 RepID=A0ABV8Q358_9MICO